MKREDIIRMATSAGIDVSIAESNIKILERFAVLVAAHEREDRIDHDILSICDAYEAGFGHGLEKRGLPNPYREESSQWKAWNHGYELGESRSKQ